MYYKLANAAAKWWIEQIKNQCQRISPEITSGYGSNIKVLDKTLGEKLGVFEELLRNEFLEHLKTYDYFHIGCCYYPNDLLIELAEKANLSTSYFPMHAQLTIAKNSIYVSVGYEEQYKLNIDCV